MISQFDQVYWERVLYLLVAMHSVDLCSFSIELHSFTRRKFHLLRFKLVLDIVSFCLSLCIQGFFGASFTTAVEGQYILTDVDEFGE